MKDEKPKRQARRRKTANQPNLQNPAPEISENTVFIRQKPVMNYVNARLTHLNGGSKKVLVKARGRATPKAVETVDLLTRAFTRDLQLHTISLGTEEVERTARQRSKISAIEIAVTKPQPSSF